MKWNVVQKICFECAHARIRVRVWVCVRVLCQSVNCGVCVCMHVVTLCASALLSFCHIFFFLFFSFLLFVFGAPCVRLGTLLARTLKIMIIFIWTQTVNSRLRHLLKCARLPRQTVFIHFSVTKNIRPGDGHDDDDDDKKVKCFRNASLVLFSGLFIYFNYARFRVHRTMVQFDRLLLLLLSLTCCNYTHRRIAHATRRQQTRPSRNASNRTRTVCYVRHVTSSEC